jgi:hypothetical protein
MTNGEILPESVRKRIDDFMARTALMTPDDMRRYVTLLCEAAYCEGVLAVEERVKGAIAP